MILSHFTLVLPQKTPSVLSKFLASRRAHKMTCEGLSKSHGTKNVQQLLGHHPLKCCQSVPKLGLWLVSILVPWKFQGCTTNWFVVSWDTANSTHYEPTHFLSAFASFAKIIRHQQLPASWTAEQRHFLLSLGQAKKNHQKHGFMILNWMGPQ